MRAWCEALFGIEKISKNRLISKKAKNEQNLPDPQKSKVLLISSRKPIESRDMLKGPFRYHIKVKFPASFIEFGGLYPARFFGSLSEIRKIENSRKIEKIDFFNFFLFSGFERTKFLSIYLLPIVL